MATLDYRTAADLAALLRRRECSARELLDHHLARIAARDPALNAVVTLDVERARARADAADAALARGESWGPLHGVPMTVKETFETEGLRTTAGFEPFTSHVPAADAVAVARLKAAGAVVFGKTNTPTLAGDWQSYNPLFGFTHNPWDLSRTPGGSSGGSGAALAAGLTPLELGSDIAGSIRVPAHWCGIYGHKPTHGIIPQRGHIPGPPGTLATTDLATVGPMARSAADLDLALGILAGPLPDRAAAWRLTLPAPRHAALRDYRVAAWLDDATCPVDAEVAAPLDAAVTALERAGVRVDRKVPDGLALADVVRTYVDLLWPIMLAGTPDDVFDSLVAAASGGGTDPFSVLTRSGTLRHRDWLRANEMRERLRARLGAFFEDYDVLLLPTNPVPAIAHDHSEPMTARSIRVNGVDRPYFDLLAWIALATTTLHPATTAPVGHTSGGLPVGIQIVGPHLEDRTPIAFAGHLADVVGGFVVPPGY
jgi:amidase